MEFRILEFNGYFTVQKEVEVLERYSFFRGCIYKKQFKTLDSNGIWNRFTEPKLYKNIEQANEAVDLFRDKKFPIIHNLF